MAKRHPGVFSVKGRKGISYGIDYAHPQTGQRVRKILKEATSAAEAFGMRSIEIADAKRGAVNKAYGIKDKSQVVSFEAMVKAYLKWFATDRKSFKTYEYNSIPLVKAFKGKLMSDIHPLLLEKYKRERAKLVSQKTVNHELSLGSQVYMKAAGWDKYDGVNPFHHKATPRYKVRKGKKPGSLTPDEAMAMIESISHSVKRDMAAYAYYTGWRISEIRKLKWEDVNPDAGTAWIVDPKNGKTVEIELGDEALETIKRQPKRDSADFVFCHKNGKPYKSNLHAVIKNAAERVGVQLPPRKAWHIFRRTWASLMLQNGCDVETLRVLGNWEDISMPLWYAEAAGRRQRRKALNRVPSLNGRKMAEIQKVVSING